MKIFCVLTYSNVGYEVEAKTLRMHSISQPYKYEREKQLEDVVDANCHTGG
jgi:hypothetical protein